MLALLLFGVVLIGLFLLRREYLSRTRRHRECGDKIPGPKPLPLIGNAWEFGLSTKTMFDYMNSLTRQYGPVARAWVGPKLGILLADPPSIEALLGNTRNLNKSSVYDIGAFCLGQGLLVNKGETWKRHHKIIAPTFKGQILAQFIDVFNSNLEILTNKLSQHVNGPEFDILPFLNVFTLDIISESAMGVKVNAQLHSDSDYVKGVHCMEEILFKRAFRPWLHPDIIFNLTPLGRQQAKYLPIVQGLTRKVIQERKKQRAAEAIVNGDSQDEDIGYNTKKPFLDYLLDYIDQGAQLTNEELEHEVDTIMTAGHDTTATSMSFTCWLLAKHQHIQEKVVAELRTIFGGSMRPATVQDLSEMKYLEQVIKESLRILPASPLYGRQLSEDITTDKYVFPAGCEIGVNVFMLHRHPEYFPEPERFDPDRFLPENCVGRHPYCYIPFSAGPRVCLGVKFAMMEMKVTIAELLRHYKVLPPDNPFHAFDLSMQIILKPVGGIPIKLQSRKSVDA